MKFIDKEINNVINRQIKDQKIIFQITNRVSGISYGVFIITLIIPIILIITLVLRAISWKSRILYINNEDPILKILSDFGIFLLLIIILIWEFGLFNSEYNSFLFTDDQIIRLRRISALIKKKPKFHVINYNDIIFIKIKEKDNFLKRIEIYEQNDISNEISDDLDESQLLAIEENLNSHITIRYKSKKDAESSKKTLDFLIQKTGFEKHPLFKNMYAHTIISSKNSKKSAMPRQDDSFPHFILNSIPKDEKVLYKSDKISNKKDASMDLIEFLIIFAVLVLIVIILTFVLTMTIWLGLLCLILLLVIAPFGMFSISKAARNMRYMLITDKRIFLIGRTQRSREKFRIEGFIDLKLINTFGFHKRIMDNSGDCGTVYMIYNNRSVTLTNIPNFSTFQKTFESIVISFSNIIKQELGLQATLEPEFPIIYYISDMKLNLIQKSIKKNILKLILIIALTPIVSFILAAVVFILFPFLFLLVFIIGTLFGVTFVLIPIKNIILMKKRANKKGNTLELFPTHVILKDDGLVEKHTYDSSTCLHFITIYKEGDNLKEKFDAIIIKPAFNSKSNIIFGPIDHLFDGYDTVSNFLLMWKYQNGFLFGRDDLLKVVGIRN